MSPILARLENWGHLSLGKEERGIYDVCTKIKARSEQLSMGLFIRGAAYALVAGIVLVLVLNIPLPQNVGAAIACNGQAFHWVGTTNQVIKHYGLDADISDYNPNLCGANWSDSSAWVMTTVPSQSCDYVQVGYEKYDGLSNIFEFTQYSYLGSNNQCVVGGVGKINTIPVNTLNYWVIYKPTKSYTRMKIAGTVVDRTSWDAPTVWGTGPSNWAPLWSGETHDSGDDMPGIPSPRATFFSLEIIPCDGCAGITPSGLVLQNNPFVSRYSYEWNISNVQFQIWTNSGY